ILILFSFGGNKSQKPETPPEIIAEITTSAGKSVSTPATTGNTYMISGSYTTTYHHDIITSADTIPHVSTTVSSQITESKNDGQTDTYTESAGISSQEQEINSSDTTEPVSSGKETTETTTTASIYYSSFFSHTYTTADIDADNPMFYGYPDDYIFDDILKSQFSSDSPIYDYLLQSLVNMLLFEPSTAVEGEITNLTYIAYEGKPWTICEIEVTDVYHFDLCYPDNINIINTGDRINIAMPGGYMSVNEYISLNPDSTLFSGWSEEQKSSSVIYEAGSNQNKPEIGDRYAYYLEPAKLDMPYDRLYIRKMMCDICQFNVNDDILISCNSFHSDFPIQKSMIIDSDSWEYFYDDDNDRCIAFRDESSLLYGAFSCYSVSADGKLIYLGYFNTENGFFPFRDSKHYNLIWNKNSVTVQYHTNYNHTENDEFSSAELSIPE
ncbi:MAG: hypothetical protein K2N49_04055, partial [Ruminococcus sp.]|nr:hypothetical protein [Ruminococcus sp.]